MEAAGCYLGGEPPIPVQVPFTSRDGALAWLDTRRTELLALIETVAGDDWYQAAARNLPTLMARPCSPPWTLNDGSR